MSLLNKNIANPFICGKIRIQSATSSQMTKKMIYTLEDYQGDSGFWRTIYPMVYINQYFAGATETPTDFQVNEDAKLQFEIQPKTEVTYFFYPAKIASLSNTLESKPSVTEYEEPTHISIKPTLKY